MHILLSNDDGYLAEGLVALANALRKYAEITVVSLENASFILNLSSSFLTDKTKINNKTNPFILVNFIIL